MLPQEEMIARLRQIGCPGTVGSLRLHVELGNIYATHTGRK
jgi:hypothetical protein